MTPTRPWVLAVLAVICAAIAWAVVRAEYSSLPTLPWTAALAMLVLGVAEALSGRNLRARLRGGPGVKPVPPLAAVRMAALAKASSHAAAIIGGLAAGFLIYLAGSLGKTVPRSDAFAAAGTLLAGVALLLGALYLEQSCRLPKDDDDDRDTEPSSQSPR